MQQTHIWILFNVFVLFMLALDLGLFHRKTHEITVKEALSWTVFWIALALLFNLGIYLEWIPTANPTKSASDFLTGFLLEKSLSVDNLFVMLLVFNYFKIPRVYQHKILFWGILGALIMRGVLIVIGAALIQEFHWILYLFGAFLVFTGLKMLFDDGEEEIEPERNPVIRLFKRMMPVTPEFHGERFFVTIDKQRFATPLMVALIVVEVSDLIFAVDSIPAIFSVTQDPFIVYTSNVFAILGLRSLYFALAAIMDKFHYLKYGLALILSLIGIKMLVKDFFHDIPSWVTLSMVAGTLALSMLASLLFPPREKSEDLVLATKQEKDSVHG